MSVHEAAWYEPAPRRRVRCTLCPHRCVIADGAKGACGVRVHRGGKLYTLVYDRVVARGVEPIEKKPLFHFLPGSLAYSIATVGCNLRCAYCQNWEISQWPKQHLPRKLEWETDAETAAIGCAALEALGDRIPGERVTPAAIVEAALASGARSIAYTYTEPTIFFELAYDTAVLARKRGLRNVFVTNGFISEGPLRQMAEVLDAVNVDLKFFRDESYRRVSRVRLAPILEAVRLYRALGVWTEVTTLVVPGVNDSDDELRQIAKFLCSVDVALPWHVSQFQPAWKMLDRPVTPLETLRRARKIGLEAGLRFVYEGNVPGEGGENTHCPACGTLLVRRYGLTLISNRIANGACPDCHEKIEGEEMTSGEGTPGGRNAATILGRPQHGRAKLVATSRGFRERPAWNALKSALPDAWLRGSGFRGVLVVEAEGDPLVLAEHCVRRCGEAIGHVTPVLAEVPTELGAIRDAAARVAVAQVGARQSVCFRMRRRGWMPPGREPLELEGEIGAAVLDALERSLGTRPRVDLEQPDVTIVAEVLGAQTAVGAVPRSRHSGEPAPGASGTKEG